VPGSVLADRLGQSSPRAVIVSGRRRDGEAEPDTH